jgi:photosystem II stability/assembly factor-like uncharacterized protein
MLEQIMQTERFIPSTDDTLPPRSRPRWLWLAALGVVALLILVEVGYQLWKSSPAATAPSVAGRPLSNPQTHLHVIALGDAPGMVYLGTHFGLFWSTDGGRTWPQPQGALPGLMITSIAANPVDADALAVVGLSNVGDASQNGLYLSQDAGKTWRMSSPSLPSSGLGSPISPYFVKAGADAGRWYVVFVGAGLYETRDDGAHWALLTPPTLANALITSLLIDPTGAGHLLLGTDAGLYQTVDDGGHWDAVAEVQQSVQALAVLPTAPETILCATSAGLWRSTDGGLHFQSLAGSSLSRLAVAGTQNEMLYGVSGQQLWRSSDAGSHWTIAARLDRSDLTALVGDPDNAQKLYAGYFFPPAVFSSQDAGSSWQVVTS